MKKVIEKLITEKLINPVLHSTAPVSEVSLGVAVGVFFGLTPTVGVQMYLVALVWSIYRYIFSRHFNLPVGVAMVWISNPLTMVPMYRVSLIHISSTEGTWETIVASARFLLIDLGWPMIIGSIVYAVPGFIISYFMTERIVTSHRKSKASLAGMSYDDCRTQKETQH